jgi:L,D-transpeptidase ErfK/SrfK
VASHRFVLTQDTVVGLLQMTWAGADDTLPDIARRFNIGFDELALANPNMDPWSPGVGHEVILPTQFVLPDAPHEGVVINVAAMRLFYYPKHAPGAPQVVITHPIGIGRVGWRTPEGVTRVTAREKDPVWIPPLSVRREHLEDGERLPARVPAGPDNPLGNRLFRLGWPSYLIHGTNKPYGVGMRSSHGCVRLYPEDIERLYDLVPIGTPVRIVNQPVLFGWQGEALLLQAYEALEDDHRKGAHDLSALRKRITQKPLFGHAPVESQAVDWTLAQTLMKAPRAVPVNIIRNDQATVLTALAAAHRVLNSLPIGATWVQGAASLADEKQYQEMLDSREPAPVSLGDAAVSREKKKTEPAKAGSAQHPVTGDEVSGAH